MARSASAVRPEPDGPWTTSTPSGTGSRASQEPTQGVGLQEPPDQVHPVSLFGLHASGWCVPGGAAAHHLPIPTRQPRTGKRAG